MIFVDTSVWVEALRSAESKAARELGGLLDAGEVALSVPVRLEILAGASNRDHLCLRRVLSALRSSSRPNRRGSASTVGWDGQGRPVNASALAIS